MDTVVPVVGVVIVCYLAGSIPFGWILGKLKGVNVREAGSGNIGATNVWRTCGAACGLACFALDFLKGFVPVFAAVWLSQQQAWPAQNLVPFFAALAAVAGHVFPVWLKFRGGKGIATSAGAVLGVPGAWLPLVIALAVWAAVLLIGRYMSVASMAAAIALAASGFFLLTDEEATPKIVLLVFLAAVAVWRHLKNIDRLRRGKEPRFSFKTGIPLEPDEPKKKKKKKKKKHAQAPVAPVAMDAAQEVVPEAALEAVAEEEIVYEEEPATEYVDDDGEAILAAVAIDDDDDVPEAVAVATEEYLDDDDEAASPLAIDPAEFLETEEEDEDHRTQ